MVQLVAAVEGGPRTSAMLTHVGALINAGSAALAPADLSSLVAAHSSEGSTDADIASAADAFGVSSRPEGPGGMPQGLPPNLTEAAVQSSGPGSRARPIDETLPPLGDVVSGKSGSDVTVRQPAASDSADGVVVQVTLRFGSWAALSSPAATAAIQATLLGLVKALGLPAGATVKIDLVVQDDSGGGSSGRRLQAGGASALAVVGVDLNQTSSDDPAFGSSVSAASRLGASVAQQLGSTSGTVGAALLSAIIEADPAAAEGGVSVDADAGTLC
ncbi:hypothetical protein FNF28_00173 [Cafeteria roenbergensis]|uniref:Uncharacterized protein n=1 Tax=Cafeteria roenbergensis TaxID=33653 RepID=A0A5A8E826_CAFRO|nr:hypothetical protein FNF28_00173 [Cafeteria roenbergensis]